MFVFGKLLFSSVKLYTGRKMVTNVDRFLYIDIFLELISAAAGIQVR